ncbi:MAG: class I SAM-dependent methyltransferase [Chloroflexia bacterium]
MPSPYNSNPEADFIYSLRPAPSTILDAGCGTGRLAIALYERGFSPTGVDISTSMLSKPRFSAPHLSWRLGDISCVRLEKRFDAIVLAGNVMIFLRKGTEQAVLSNMARHLAPSGTLITGFFLSMGRLQIDDYDRYAKHAGLTLEARYSGWQREPWQYNSNYAVSLHKRKMQK